MVGRWRSRYLSIATPCHYRRAPSRTTVSLEADPDPSYPVIAAILYISEPSKEKSTGQRTALRCSLSVEVDADCPAALEWITSQLNLSKYFGHADEKRKSKARLATHQCCDEMAFQVLLCCGLDLAPSKQTCRDEFCAVYRIGLGQNEIENRIGRDKLLRSNEITLNPFRQFDSNRIPTEIFLRAGGIRRIIRRDSSARSEKRRTE